MWSLVDLDRRLITVARSFDKTTKTQRIRRVPILDPLLPMLRQWKIRCAPSEGQWAFPNRKGNMHAPRARVFKEIYHRTLQRSGIGSHHPSRHLTYHDLRHTFASLWVQNGGDLFRLQKILGHRDVHMTLRHAHLSPDVFANDYDRLGRARIVDQLVQTI